LTTYQSTYRQTQAPRVFAAYMGRISRGGLLSPREELELGRRASAGDSEARRLLVENNLRLGIFVERKHRGRGLPFEEPIQEGNIVLMKAENSRWPIRRKLPTPTSSVYTTYRDCWDNWL
jgi:RNA polymerase primary sigma factor